MRISRGNELEKSNTLLELEQCRKLFCRWYDRLWLVWLCGWNGVAGAVGMMPETPLLPPEVRQALAAANIDPAQVSVEVWGKNEAQPRVRWHGSVPRNPASLMKLLTGGLALEQWGPGKIWYTEILRPSSEEGNVASSLAVVSAGDPDLSLARWQSLWRQVYQQGITTIAGDVIVESTETGEKPDEFDGQGFRAYNVIPAAIQVDQQTQWWVIRPGQREGAPVDIWSDYPFPDVQVVNHVVTRMGSCPGLWRDELRYRIIPSDYPREPLPTRPNVLLDHGVTVEWSGSVRQGCGVHVWGLSVLTNTHFLDSTLRTFWQEQGGRWHGVLREGSIDSTWRVVATSESRPLLEILMEMNRNSNNVVARHLYDDLTQFGVVPMVESLGRLGLRFPELVVENGSGLSRRSRLSADSLAYWLKWMEEVSPYAKEFMVTLPMVGVEGTVKDGFTELRERHFRLKSGTLNQVKGLAGYAQDAEGKEVVVVFIVNGANAEKAGIAELALLNWVATDSKTPQNTSKKCKPVD